MQREGKGIGELQCLWCAVLFFFFFWGGGGGDFQVMVEVPVYVADRVEWKKEEMISSLQVPTF